MSAALPRRRIYLDHASTTPVRAEVLEAMRPFFAERFGNPSSLHAEGGGAREALEMARREILSRCGAADFDLIFTSSGTEGDNTALLGVVLAGRKRSRERGEALRLGVVTTAVEHSAVLGTLPLLRELGASVTVAGADRDGRVDLELLRAAIRPDTLIVSVMAANNETGALQPIEEAAHLARANGSLFHTDAVQLLGKLPLRLDSLPADLATVSSHKLCGPRGTAGLFVRKGIAFEPLLRGGSQEMGLRGGTENVAAAVGFARAVQLADAEREGEMARLGKLRDALRAQIAGRYPRAVVNTPADRSLPTILNVSFPWIEGESLTKLLDALGVAASTGSACNVGARKPSHVLQAMGRGEREVRGSLRISLGRSTSDADMREFLDCLEQAVEQLGAVAPRLP